MKLEIEQTDIEAIASRVAEILKPLLANSPRSKEREIFFDVVQLSEYLNVSRSWIYERIRGNTIPYTKLGKFLRFKKSEIDGWAESKSIKSSGPLNVIKPSK
jgi:excisionase family DNA binding protein